MVKAINGADVKSTIEKGCSIIKFGADWCSACKAIDPQYKELSSKFVSVNFLDMDVEKNVDFSLDLGVRAIPSYAFYKDGELVSLEKGMQIKEIYNKLKEMGGV